MTSENLVRSCHKLIAAAAAVAQLTGCGAAPDQPESYGTTQSEIRSGDAVAAADVHIRITAADGSKFCSGTLLNERWVVTAKECFYLLGDHPTLDRDAETRTVANYVPHPSLDVLLVQASSAFANVWPTSMYPWSPQTLVGQPVTCYGYGHNVEPTGGAGTLRRGAMQVVWADGSSNPLLTVVPADSRHQITLDGDFGGGCFLENKSRALVGVASFNARSLETEEVNVAGYVPTSGFSRWALPLISDSSQRLICHGRECLTNPTPLPDRLSQEVAWRPCSGQLTGPGSYPFGYELVYDMELNYDSVLMNGSFHTGAGTETGTSYASHLGNRVAVYTDRNGPSNGISWLRAHCPNDP